MYQMSKSEIIPYGHRIAVVDPPADEQNKTYSGLYVPQNLQEPLRKGIISAISEGYDSSVEEFTGWKLKVGDVVWYKFGCAHQVGDTNIIEADCVVAVEKIDDEER